jgi:hypothetical protein
MQNYNFRKALICALTVLLSFSAKSQAPQFVARSETEAAKTIKIT